MFRSYLRHATMGLGFMILAWSGVSYGEQSAADESNPFMEGTLPVKLTAPEVAELVQYIQMSVEDLESALTEAKDKGRAVATRIYRIAIEKVVRESHRSGLREELPMRIVLNQGLELAVGLPGASPGERSGAVVTGTINPDLVLAILEDSIRLALQYAGSDAENIAESGSLIELPYLRMAHERKDKMIARDEMIFSERIGARYCRAILQHWLNVAARYDQLHKGINARAIVRVDRLLKRAPSLAKLMKLEPRDARMWRNAFIKELERIPN